MHLRRPRNALPSLQRSRGRLGTADAGWLQDRSGQRRLAQLSWSREFDEPISIPGPPDPGDYIGLYVLGVLVAR
jgi:hypothetical protein